MENTLETFQKTKPFLVCVDSDGCAMDTMNCKHIRCFGPCAVEEWHLQAWEKELLTLWNTINLYSLTRGVNRFKGLGFFLQAVHKQYTEIVGLDGFLQWVNHAKELSNQALQKHIRQNNNICMEKALRWSRAVNASIEQLPDNIKKPFIGVKEGLQSLYAYADIAVVSSANKEAVLEEWAQHGLLAYVDVVLAQTDGSKADCIAGLLQKGYEKNNVLMIGDAQGDLQAAQKNSVHFYPVLVRSERQSWAHISSDVITRLVQNTYAEKQADYINAFMQNLQPNP